MRGLIVDLTINLVLVAHCRASPRDLVSQKLRGSQQRQKLLTPGAERRLEPSQQQDQAAPLKSANKERNSPGRKQPQQARNASDADNLDSFPVFSLEALVHPTFEWSRRVVQESLQSFDVELAESFDAASSRNGSKPKPSVKPVFVIGIVSPFGIRWKGLCIWAVVVLIFGCIYNELKQTIKPYLMMDREWAYDERGDPKDFSIGIFQVYQEPKLLCFSCCCGAVRWSETISMSGFMSFFSGLMLFIVITFASNVSVAWIVCIGWLTYFRQMLRQEYDLDYGDPFTIAEDCCTYCLCSPCAVAQEAIHVERAKKETIWSGIMGWFG